MERTSALPVRVYCPSTGVFSTAEQLDNVGVLCRHDDGSMHYYAPASLVEVVKDDGKGSADLIDGRRVLYGREG